MAAQTPGWTFGRAEQLVYTASTQIPTYEKQIEQQENYISILLGQNPGPIMRGWKLTEQPLLPSVPAGLPSQLIERRPDIRQAEEQLIAAIARIGVAESRVLSIHFIDRRGWLPEHSTYKPI